jgi:hypothetical protein
MRKGVNKLMTPLGMKVFRIQSLKSSPSNMAPLEDLPQHLIEESDPEFLETFGKMYASCHWKTCQGMVQIKEL